MATMRKAQRLPSARTKNLADPVPTPPLDTAMQGPTDWQTQDLARSLTLAHPRVQKIHARITQDLAKVAAKHSKGSGDMMASKKSMENMESPALKKQEASMATKATKSGKKGAKKGKKDAKMAWMK
jgi:hypothetical protein